MTINGILLKILNNLSLEKHLFRKTKIMKAKFSAQEFLKLDKTLRNSDFSPAHTAVTNKAIRNENIK